MFQLMAPNDYAEVLLIHEKVFHGTQVRNPNGSSVQTRGHFGLI